MLLSLHKNATTTPLMRQAIREAEGTVDELAARFGQLTHRPTSPYTTTFRRHVASSPTPATHTNREGADGCRPLRKSERWRDFLNG